MLATAGAFRVVPMDELRRPDDRTQAHRKEVERLRSMDLVRTMPYIVGRDRTTLVTLTERGRDVLGDVSPRTVSGAAAGVLRGRLQATRTGARRPRPPGLPRSLQASRSNAASRVRRVVLEQELKREYQAFLQEPNRGRRRVPDGRSATPTRSPDGPGSTHCQSSMTTSSFPTSDSNAMVEMVDREIEDVEVMTPHYRGAHAAAKVQRRVHPVRCCGRPPERCVRLPAVGAWTGRAPGRGDAVVTFDDRVKALGTRGFTDRQARFLVTVMLHSGVCMVRQYCAFAGMVYGQTARDFFARLTAHRIATAFDCAHKRARIYHIRNRALYQTIGEPHSRLRKPVTFARAIERVMLLDAVLGRSTSPWLATEGEKVEHFSLTAGERPQARGVPMSRVRRRTRQHRPILP